MTDSPNLADTLPEPDDGSMVIVRASEYDIRTYQRLDRQAARCQAPGEERWFDRADIDDEPVSWRTVLAYATHVWERGPLLASQQSGEAP